MEINATYEHKILVEVTRYTQLAKDKEEAAKKYHERKEYMESEHIKRLSDLTEEQRSR